MSLNLSQDLEALTLQIIPNLACGASEPEWLPASLKC